MRKVEENKEEEKGTKLTIEKEVQIEDTILEKGDEVIIYPKEEDSEEKEE